MALKFVSPKIVREIIQKMERLEKTRGFPFLINGLHERFLEKEAVIHSYKMEFPDEFATGVTNNFNAHPSKRSTRKGIANLRNAFNWARQNYDSEKIDDHFVQNVTGRIDPSLYPGQSASYRTFGVRVTGANWTPPYAEKINLEMLRFFKELRELLSDSSVSSQLEASAYVHLHLVRIHPFEDGNGRTARTLQNTILKSAGLPPPIIYTGERYSYHDALQESINGWRKRSGSLKPTAEEIEQERKFYDYISGKISATLDRLL